ncbi:MAG: HTH domain-containing protein [Verrucomicrobiota bacterium]
MFKDFQSASSTGDRNHKARADQEGKKKPVTLLGTRRVSIGELCERLNISRTTVHRWEKAG